MSFDLNAQKRTLQGSSASRRLRRAGKVPGIVYGGQGEPVAIEVDHNTLLLSLRKEAFHSSLINMNLDGEVQEVLLRDVQAHPYKPVVLHVDFQRVTRGVALHMEVPLHFLNADVCPGVKLGHGIASHAMNSLEVEVLPKDLPEFIEVDLKALNLGDSIYVSDLKLPAGVKAMLHGQEDALVATIVPPQKDEAEEVVEEEAEVKVVAKGKAKDEEDGE
jgi:large subunit ribosomal protein L25